MNISDLTTLIAVASGLVGTFGGVLISYLSLKYRKDKDRPIINVRLANSFLVGMPGVDADKEYLTVSVANVGEQIYTITLVGIELGKRSGGIAITNPLGTVTVPYELQPGNTCDFWTEYDSAHKQLKNLEGRKRKRMKIRASLKDYSGRVFCSDWMKIDFEHSQFWKLVDKIKSFIRKCFTKLFP